jgi:hypothetical protein
MKDVRYLAGGGELAPLGFIETSRSHAFTPGYGNVDEASRHGRGANAVDFNDVLGDQIGRSMNDVISDGAPNLGRRYFDNPRPLRQTPEMCAGGVTCYRACSASQNRNRHGTLPGRRRARHQVDAR